MSKETISENMIFLVYLQELINKRKVELPEGSYTTMLFKKGLPFLAKKVGEEATELVIESCNKDNDELFLNEAADLIYHILVLLSAREYGIEDVARILKERHE